jgi:hypothetical protein
MRSPHIPHKMPADNKPLFAVFSPRDGATITAGFFKFNLATVELEL